MEETDLTPEQKKFLEECENEFKDRYTEKDTEFVKTKNMEIKDPPIFHPWYSHNSRNGPSRGYTSRRHYNRNRPY
ncbi:hypothetical protein ANTPLA_LOCUS9206 [Anthophora plagiata]